MTSAMISAPIRALRTDLAAVLGFFTRLPVGWLMPGTPRIDMARAVWAYPLAGGVVGLAGAAVYALTAWLPLPPLLCACWSFAAMLLLTGALHEDGLADMADGFGGGRDAARKLEIMRDSRIGSYGALALLVTTLLRISAVAAIAAPARVALALIVAGVLSRAAIVAVLVCLPPARSDGIAASLRRIPRPAAMIAACIAMIAAVLLLPGWMRLAALLCTLVTALLVARLAARQIGGHSGDVLGAAAVLAESALLSCLCADSAFIQTR